MLKAIFNKVFARKKSVKLGTERRAHRVGVSSSSNSDNSGSPVNDHLLMAAMISTSSSRECRNDDHTHHRVSSDNGDSNARGAESHQSNYHSSSSYSSDSYSSSSSDSGSSSSSCD